MVSQKEYEQFFEILEKIVDEEIPVAQKMEKLQEAAESISDSALFDLEEFTSWCFDF